MTKPIQLYELMGLSGAICLTAVAANGQPAPAGAVVLHIAATGASSDPADLIVVSVPITAQADTAVGARASNQATIDRLRKALVARGIESGAISLVPDGGAQIGFIGNAAYDPDDEGSAGAAMLAKAMARKTAFSLLRITLDTPAKLDQVRAALDAENLAMVSAPALALRDDRRARQAAITDALTKANADAETYAATLGMKVSAITRVSNEGRADGTPDYVMEMMTPFRAKAGAPNEVVTRASVVVDFALQPR